MARKRVLKITSLLVTLNILVLLLILGYYSFRLVKYYKLEHGKSSDNSKTLLVDKLRSKESRVDLTKGLVYYEDENIYKYKGEVNDNYLLYSGMMFRIVGIDNRNNIVAVSEDDVTVMFSGLFKGYNDSYINTWLNNTETENSGVYQNILYNSEELLESTLICTDKIDDTSNITCKESDDSNYIGLLSLYDYKEAGGKSSYLNNNQSYYLSTVNGENKAYFITESGDISALGTSDKVNGVRPVITINYNTELISGNGKESSPYIIEKHDIKTLRDVYVNNYIKYNDQIFKTVGIYEDSVRVASTKLLQDETGDVVSKFNDGDNEYTSKTTIGKLLNKTYLESLENSEYIVDSKWNTGVMTLAELNYGRTFETNVTAKVGMLSLGELYVQDFKGIWTLTKGIESDQVMEVITSDANIYSDVVTSEYNIRAAFNLDNKLKITGGSGTLESPFELGGYDEESQEG